jgi:hypothetical protein
MHRSTKIVLVSALAVAAAAAAAAAERKDILAWAIERYLSAHGYPEAHLAVTEFTRDRITLESIVLTADAPSAARIAVTSYLDENFEIDVEGLRVPVDMRRGAGGAGFADSIRGLLEKSAEPMSVTRAIKRPILVVRDAAVAVRGLDGGEIVAAIDGTADFRRSLPLLKFHGKVASAHTNGVFRLETDDASNSPDLRFELSGESDLAAAPWPAGVPQPKSGRAAFSLEVTVPMPVFSNLPRQPLPEHSLAARLDLRLKSVAVPSRVSSLAADISLRVIAGPMKARVSLLQPAHVVAQGIALPELAALGPAAAPLADRLAHGVEITLSGGSPALAADTTDTSRMNDAEWNVPEGSEPAAVWIERDDGGWSQDTAASVTAAMTGGDATLQLRAHTSFDTFFRPRGPQTARFLASAGGISLGAAELTSFVWQGAADMDKGEFAAYGPLQLASASRSGGLPGGISYSGDVN